MNCWTQRLPPPVRKCSLSRLSRRDLVSRGGIHIVGLDLGITFQLVTDQAGNVLELLVVILLGLFTSFPEANGQYSVGIVGGDERELVHESSLVSEDWQGFVPIVLQTSRALPLLVVTSTTLVNIEALLSLVGVERESRECRSHSETKLLRLATKLRPPPTPVNDRK